MLTVERPVALVTGGSRGVGAGAALAFAEIGYDVALTYRNKTARATEVAAAAVERGVRALKVQCDITVGGDIDRLLNALKEWAGRLDALVLSAAGGLERELVSTDPQYPMRVNRDAQVALLDGALPFMTPGGVVIFVTSHWAHLYGRIEPWPGYGPVAESKHAGELALRARQPMMMARGVRLVVVTADLIAGTITPRLMERRAPGLIAQRQAALGRVPTTEEVGRAIAAAATNAALPSGHVVVIGGTLDALL